MKMKSLFYMACFPILIFFFSFGCGNSEQTETKTLTDKDSIMDIKAVTVTLPYAKGLSLVETSCVPCHSLRFIEIQPNFNHKTWNKIVTKMIKNFGAPIQDTVVRNEIVDYLVAAKGKE